MGMAASQVRFLQLTNRKHDIGLELEHLSSEKTALARDMRKVSKDYQNSLSTKTLKWSNNQGVGYSELGYGTLMRPGAANGNHPVLLSDSGGRIVIDDKYKEYAEMISKNGASGGDYKSHRTEILKALTGIGEEDFSKFNSASSTVSEKQKIMDDAYKARENFRNNNCKEYDEAKFISKFMNSNNLGIDSKINSGNIHQNIEKVLSALNKNYFSDDTFEAFKANCQEIEKVGLKDDIDSETFLSQIFGALQTALGANSKVLVWESGKEKEYEALNKVYEDAKADYEKAAGGAEEVFTANDEKQIAFYDELFTAIADNGWKHDTGVDDSDYLNQMLINNQYYITTMTDATEYSEDGSKKTKYDYSATSASTYKNIFVVNDSDARDEALVKYEYEKSIINTKESRIDTRMKNLETEQSAISKMLESIEQVKNDNIERTFGIWG